MIASNEPGPQGHSPVGTPSLGLGKVGFRFPAERNRAHFRTSNGPMTLHLIKLCVGVETPRKLAAWQARHLKRLARAGKKPEHCHRTLQTPRRRDEILDGGSLYWVSKGFVLVRQRVLELRGDGKKD